MALVYNGDIVNAELLYEELSRQGHTFCSSTDADVIPDQAILSLEKGRVDKIRYVVQHLQEDMPWPS
ncbi:MAG: hypothetical protein DRH97_02705 [Chloroflexi bacterium]|nr:MAG: hypothetical protein DRH97_02705 [Chloroflexota bacterium]